MIKCKYCGKDVYWRNTQNGARRLYDKSGFPHKCSKVTTSGYNVGAGAGRIGETIAALRSIGASIDDDNDGVAVIQYAPKANNKSSNFKRKKKRHFMASTVLNFGKYNGRSITWVIQNDIGYVKWMVDNFDDFFSEDIINAIK